MQHAGLQRIAIASGKRVYLWAPHYSAPHIVYRAADEISDLTVHQSRLLVGGDFDGVVSLGDAHVFSRNLRWHKLCSADSTLAGIAKAKSLTGGFHPRGPLSAFSGNSLRESNSHARMLASLDSDLFVVENTSDLDPGRYGPGQDGYDYYDVIRDLDYGWEHKERKNSVTSLSEGESGTLLYTTDNRWIIRRRPKVRKGQRSNFYVTKATTFSKENAAADKLASLYYSDSSAQMKWDFIRSVSIEFGIRSFSVSDNSALALSQRLRGKSRFVEVQPRTWEDVVGQASTFSPDREDHVSDYVNELRFSAEAQLHHIEREVVVSDTLDVGCDLYYGLTSGVLGLYTPSSDDPSNREHHKIWDFPNGITALALIDEETFGSRLHDNLRRETARKVYFAQLSKSAFRKAA